MHLAKVQGRDVYHRYRFAAGASANVIPEGMRLFQRFFRKLGYYRNDLIAFVIIILSGFYTTLFSYIYL